MLFLIQWLIGCVEMTTFWCHFFFQYILLYQSPDQWHALCSSKIITITTGGIMQNISKNHNPNSVDLLAKSFAQSLLRQGYSRDELVRAATIIIDQLLKDGDDRQIEKSRPLSA